MQRNFGIAGLVVMVGILLVLTTASTAAGSVHVSGSVLIDGLERTYHVTVPGAYDAGEPVPLVIALHPFGSSGKAMAALTGLDAAAEDQGFIVVYPDAYDLDFNDGSQDAGWPSRLTNPDDVAFIAALIDKLSAEYAIDTGRVRLTAFAGGGSMAYRLACEIPDRFDKVAVVGALTWDFVVDACPAEPAAPVSIMLLLGSKDASQPLTGRSQTTETDTGEMRIQSLGVVRTTVFWAERNGCDLTAVQTSSDLTSQVYPTCAGGTTVEYHILEGVGSNWARVGDYVLNQFGYDTTALVTRFFNGEPLALEPVATEPVWGGAPREYALYVPPQYDPAEPMPLVVVLHGRPSSASGIAYLYDINRVAQENNFMVLYPAGTLVPGAEPGREWNYTRSFPGYYQVNVDGVEVDDNVFLQLLIDDLAQDLAIDRSRVYVTGFSNGGFMAQRLACEAGDYYAAFAALGSTLVPDLIFYCEDSPPVPMMLMNGTHDISVRWDGMVADNGIQVLYSAPDTALFWALHNGCQPEETDYTVFPSTVPTPTTFASYYSFGGCAGDSETLFYVIEGGGHNLPGVPKRLTPSIAGTVNMDIHASEVVWEFFAQHALPSEGREVIERAFYDELRGLSPTPEPEEEATPEASPDDSGAAE